MRLHHHLHPSPARKLHRVSRVSKPLSSTMPSPGMACPEFPIPTTQSRCDYRRQEKECPCALRLVRGQSRHRQNQPHLHNHWMRRQKLNCSAICPSLCKVSLRRTLSFLNLLRLSSPRPCLYQSLAYCTHSPNHRYYIEVCRPLSSLPRGVWWAKVCALRLALN